MLDRIGKILPLLNSDKPGEVQAAVAALARYDMREVAAVLELVVAALQRPDEYEPVRRTPKPAKGFFATLRDDFRNTVEW
jgi:hypothetical protein